LEKIKQKELDINSLRVPGKVKNLLKKSLELYEGAARSMSLPRQFKLGIKNLKNDYVYTRYSVDSSCSLNCELTPIEEKNISFSEGLYSEKTTLNPYSVQLIILKPKPVEPKLAPIPVIREEAGETTEQAQNVTASETVQNGNVTF